MTCYFVSRLHPLGLRPRVQSSPAVVRNIQELAVFLQIYNGTFRMFIVTVEIFFVVSIVITASMAVKYRAFREGMVAVITSSLCRALFRTVGGIYENSRDIYVALQRLEPSAILSRYKRAYRPLRVDVGRFGHADLALCLTIVSLILGNTSNLVLTAD